MLKTEKKRLEDNNHVINDKCLTRERKERKREPANRPWLVACANYCDANTSIMTNFELPT